MVGAFVPHGGLGGQVVRQTSFGIPSGMNPPHLQLAVHGTIRQTFHQLQITSTGKVDSVRGVQQYGAMQRLLLAVQTGAVVHPVARGTELAALHTHERWNPLS